MQQDDTTFSVTSTVRHAERLAERYAREAFPAWEYIGGGPTIAVVDAATGERLVERKL